VFVYKWLINKLIDIARPPSWHLPGRTRRIYLDGFRNVRFRRIALDLVMSFPVVSKKLSHVSALRLLTAAVILLHVKYSHSVTEMTLKMLFFDADIFYPIFQSENGKRSRSSCLV